MTSSHTTPEEARRQVQIQLKFKTGAITSSEDIAHGQAMTGITLARCAPFMTQRERVRALHTYHDIIKSESSLVLFDLLINALERGANPATAIMHSAQSCSSHNAALDTNRFQLYTLLKSKIEVLCCAEDRCFSPEEI